MKSQSKAK